MTQAKKTTDTPVMPTLNRRKSLGEIISDNYHAILQKTQRAEEIVNANIDNKTIEHTGRKTVHYGVVMPTSNNDNMVDIHGIYVDTSQITCLDENNKPCKLAIGDLVAMAALPEMTAGNRPSFIVRCGVALRVATIPKDIIDSMIASRARRSNNRTGQGAQDTAQTGQAPF